MLPLASAFVSAIAASSGECAFASADVVTLADSNIRIADIVELDCVERHTAERLAQIVIAHLPETRDSAIVTRRELRDRLELSVPAFTGMFAPQGEVRFEREEAGGQRVSDVRQSAAECSELTVGVSAGRALRPDWTRAVECDESRDLASLSFDQSDGFVRARADLVAGEYLGRTAIPAGELIETGSQLVLQVTVGNVRIEKQVEALEATMDADRIFVLDRAGNVFPVSVDMILASNERQEEMH